MLILAHILTATAVLMTGATGVAAFMICKRKEN